MAFATNQKLSDGARDCGTVIIIIIIIIMQRKITSNA